MAKKVEKEFDLIALLEDTKASLQKNVVAAQARSEMIDEIIQYMQANNLKVVQVTDEQVTEQMPEK